MMENIPRESLTDHQADEFNDFAMEMGATSKDTEEAYLFLCKIKEGNPSNQRVKDLYEKMEKLSREHFPINRFAEIVKNWYENENGENVYLEYINTLPLSENEIRILYSIVTKDREGELQFYIDEKPLMHFDVENVDNRNDKAFLLKGTLERVMGRVPPNARLTLLFTEK